MEAKKAKKAKEAKTFRPVRTVLFFVPEGRRILAGGETTGNSVSMYLQPRRGGRQVSSVAPPGLASYGKRSSRWFLHRLISAVPPAQKQPNTFLHTMISSAQVEKFLPLLPDADFLLPVTSLCNPQRTSGSAYLPYLRRVP